MKSSSMRCRKDVPLGGRCHVRNATWSPETCGGCFARGQSRFGGDAMSRLIDFGLHVDPRRA